LNNCVASPSFSRATSHMCQVRNCPLIMWVWCYTIIQCIHTLTCVYNTNNINHLRRLAESIKTIMYQLQWDDIASAVLIYVMIYLFMCLWCAAIYTMRKTIGKAASLVFWGSVSLCVIYIAFGPRLLKRKE